MSEFQKMVEELEKLIEMTYEDGITLDDAEKLSANFLHAQLAVSRELSKTDLDARMRKAGVKAVRGAFYLEVCAKADKKPTESALEHMIAVEEIVQREQDLYDKAEVRKAELERYYDVFLNAHIYYRGIAKGKFD